MAERGRVRRAPTLVAAVLLLAACAGDDGATPSTTTMSPTTTTSPARQSDGKLVLGVLLPTTGEGAQLGRPMIEGARLAASRINSAGGVGGQDIELIELDEGTASTATLGIDTLIEEGVDGIIGPASSIVALTNLGLAVDAGIVTCSPTASSLALDDYPDDGLFFRTIPSDSLQAVAMAEVAQTTGAPSVAVAFLDDVYGRGLATAFRSALASRNLPIVAEVGFGGGDEDLGDEAREILAAGPGAIIVLADADDGSRLIQALDNASTTRTFPPIVVNDAMRRLPPQVIQGLQRQVRRAIRGVAPVAMGTDPDLPGLYAANAYDCVNLIALSALQADTDVPDRIATQMASVSAEGSPCTSFESCARLLRRTTPLQIDYNGPSGNTELSTRTGDPIRARFEEFRFDEDGSDVSDGQPFDVSGV